MAAILTSKKKGIATYLFIGVALITKKKVVITDLIIAVILTTKKKCLSQIDLL